MRPLTETLASIAESWFRRLSEEDLIQVVRATDTAGAFGEALARGVGSRDPRYLMGMFDDYRAHLDEMPIEAA